MQHLVSTINDTLHSNVGQKLPFAVYSSVKGQHLLNVPIAKPLFIAVLSGDKVLETTTTENNVDNAELVCSTSEFVFLPDSPAINMRNIPKEADYFALLIEFEYQNLIGLQASIMAKNLFLLEE